MTSWRRRAARVCGGEWTAERPAAVLLAWALFASACGGATEGKVVQVAWQLAAADDNAAFDTRTGWHVTLEEASLALGPIYLFGAASDKVGALARLAELFVPVAHAHGGIDPETGRAVRAELLEPRALDLLADAPLEIARETAEDGAVNALRIELAADPGALPDAHGAHLYLRGAAERDGKHVRFAGGVSVPNNDVSGRIEKTKLDIALRDGATIAIEVRVAPFLDQADFERIVPADADSETERTLQADNQVGRALQIGLRNPEAYRIELNR